VCTGPTHNPSTLHEEDQCAECCGAHNLIWLPHTGTGPARASRGIRAERPKAPTFDSLIGACPIPPLHSASLDRTIDLRTQHNSKKYCRLPKRILPYWRACGGKRFFSPAAAARYSNFGISVWLALRTEMPQNYLFRLFGHFESLLFSNFTFFFGNVVFAFSYLRFDAPETVLSQIPRKYPSFTRRFEK